MTDPEEYHIPWQLLLLFVVGGFLIVGAALWSVK